MEETAKLSDYIISIGSIKSSKTGDYIVETCSDTKSDTYSDPDSTDDDDGGKGVLLYEFYKEMSTGDRDPDDICVSAAHAEIHQGVKVEHISKVWIIEIDQAKDTLDITTQKSVRTDKPKLLRNYGTNDRMLRYKRMNEHFYMDTFFATKIQGNTCCFYRSIPFLKLKEWVPTCYIIVGSAATTSSLLLKRAILCFLNGNSNPQNDSLSP